MSPLPEMPCPVSPRDARRLHHPGWEEHSSTLPARAAGLGLARWAAQARAVCTRFVLRPHRPLPGGGQQGNVTPCPIQPLGGGPTSVRDTHDTCAHSSTHTTGSTHRWTHALLDTLTSWTHTPHGHTQLDTHRFAHTALTPPTQLAFPVTGVTMVSTSCLSHGDSRFGCSVSKASLFGFPSGLHFSLCLPGAVTLCVQ